MSELDFIDETSLAEIKQKFQDKKSQITVTNKPHSDNEDDYYDHCVPGRVYMVGQGPPVRFTGFYCYNKKGMCSPQCILFNRGTCEFKLSLKSPYRDIDNLTLFPKQSSSITSRAEPPVENLEPVVRCSTQNGLKGLHPNRSFNPQSSITHPVIEPFPAKETLVVDEDDVSPQHPNVHENILPSSKIEKLVDELFLMKTMTMNDGQPSAEGMTIGGIKKNESKPICENESW